MKRLSSLSSWIVCLLVIGVIVGSFGIILGVSVAGPVLTIGSPPVGQSYQVCATGIAAVLNKHTKMKVVNKPMSGAGEYLPLVNKGEIELSMTIGDWFRISITS